MFVGELEAALLTPLTTVAGCCKEFLLALCICLIHNSTTQKYGPKRSLREEITPLLSKGQNQPCVTEAMVN